jgi:hypothetical protein
VNEPETDWDDSQASWQDRHPLLPVLLGLSGLLVIMAIVTWATFGAPAAKIGRVTKIGEVQYRSRTWRYAVVQLPEGVVRADSAIPIHCAIGDRVRVWRQKHLLGPKYSLDPVTCERQPH